MKKTAYVFLDDFGHPKSTILPVLDEIFDYDNWNVVAMDSVHPIVEMLGAPDLIVTFKNSISEIPEDKGNWYEEPFTYQWPKFVNDEGAGLLVVHAGFAFIPKDHPVITEVMHGYFAGHPPMAPLEVKIAENCDHPIIRGVEGFTSLLDEHFQVEGLDGYPTSVLAYSYSENSKEQPAAWAHPSGKGRAAVILPGHANPVFQALRHPSMIQMLKNAVNWLSEEE